jgi:hypothetical protein
MKTVPLCRRNKFFLCVGLFVKVINSVSFSACWELLASDVIWLLHETVFNWYSHSLHGETFIYKSNNTRIFVSEFGAKFHIFTNIRCDRLCCKIFQNHQVSITHILKKWRVVSNHFSLIPLFCFLRRKPINIIENLRKFGLLFRERPG